MDGQPRFTGRQPWMSDAQWRCAQLVGDLFGGLDRVPGAIVRQGHGVEVTLSNVNWAATVDQDGLTAAVVLAHDRMIRLAIQPATPRHLRLVLTARLGREGPAYRTHPTLDAATAAIRQRHRTPPSARSMS